MKVRNTLGGKVEIFEPIDRGKVGIYVCGLTVYDRMHVGHLRTFVSFDIIIRYLKFKGYKVSFVRNFTDIDDKIIDRARREGLSSRELAEKYINLFKKDISHFDLVQPDFEPRVSEHIEDIVELIKRILEKGHGYIVDGDVFFDIDSFPGYGKLSGMTKENMLAGARVEPSEKKRNPLDFALWKSKKYPDEPSWKAPWGEGRPGWHIECSAMSMKYLGETFDIHGGGIDLVFPHHENEIAQSESATGKKFVNYWLHVGHLTIEGEKMSKSLGNIINIDKILEDFHPEVVKFSFARSHYRSPLEFSRDMLKKDEKTLVNFYYTLEMEMQKARINIESGDIERIPAEGDYLKKFTDFMDEDFNTSSAFSVVFSAFDEVRKSGSKNDLLKFIAFLKEVWRATGLFSSIIPISGKSFIDEEVKRRCRKSGFTYEEICKLIEKREELRRQRKFREADEIRKKILEIGVYLQDTPEGTKTIPYV
ncbi:Cysteine--tRNA ligase [bacterium HR19]|nr:Cysteine--tRNA ligase [bacterium HR19]